MGVQGNPSSVDVVELLERGLTISSYLQVKEFAGFSHKDMAAILSVSAKTLETRKKTDKLNSTASERLLKLAEVADLGIQVFTSATLFQDWLKKPLRPLGGKKPVNLMVNMYGLEIVRNLLGRIAHGVYS